MKHLKLKSVLLLHFAFCICNCLGSADVLFPIGNMTGTAAQGRKIIVTALSVDLSALGLVDGDKLPRTTDTDGTVTITNLADGDYSLEITAPPSSKVFYFTVTNSATTLNVTNLIIPSAAVGNGVVKRIIAGANITVDPPGGTGNVTVNSLGGSGGAATNVYQLQISGGLLSLSTNLLTFVYTLAGVAQTNANMQLWGATTPNTYSNLFDLAGTGPAAATSPANASLHDLSGTTNAALFAVSNGVAASDIGDLQGIYSSLENSGVWTNFVDGILFQPRFGTNTSIKLRSVNGYRANYTPDGWGINLTNGLTMQLPATYSNITIVAMLKDNAPWQTTASIVWSLGNTNTKSGIVGTDSGSGLWQVNEHYHLTDWPGAVNGSYSNLFTPLWEFAYQYDAMLANIGQPVVVAWQRDANGNWRMYRNTTLGKISLNNGAFVYTSPTNATDPLSYFTIGFDAVTNDPGYFASALTNLNFSSVFIFNTTNYAAVVAGYKAAVCANGSDAAEFCFGDSRIAPQVAFPVHSPFDYYAQRLNPLTFAINYAEGGSRYHQLNDFYFANGGMAALTNLPSKIKNLTIDLAFGINDFYADGSSSAEVFTQMTNAAWTIRNAVPRAKIRFLDVYQIATNASALTYSLVTETNAFVFNQMVRTNNTIPVDQYIPLRDSISQAMLQTNGPFTFDGVHPNGRTNDLLNRMIGDLIDSPLNRNLTNGPIGPLDYFAVPTVSGISGVTVATTTNANGGYNYGLTVSAGGSGTVTSVGLTAPSEFSVAGSPVTGAGTLAITRTADANFLGLGATNLSKLGTTNAIIGAGTGIDATNVFQVNTLGGAKALEVSTNATVFIPSLASTTVYGPASGNLTFDEAANHSIRFSFSGTPYYNVGTNAFYPFPDFDALLDLGGFDRRWRTNYSQYVVGNGSGLTGLTAANLTGIVPMANLSPLVTTNRGTLSSALLKGDGGGGATNATAGVDYVTPSQVVNASGLKASQFVITDGSTNLQSTLNAQSVGLTNTIKWTHAGTTTNNTITFDGTRQTLTITNGPTQFYHFAGLNGSVCIQIPTNITLHFDYNLTGWLGGTSNSVVTNGALVITSFGGTNDSQLLEAIVEK